MAKTKKAIRQKRKKVLQKNLKKQRKNANTVAKRIKKMKEELWNIELDNFNEEGLLSQLTWEFKPNINLFGCNVVGFTSKENSLDNDIIQKIQKWSWKHIDGSMSIKLSEDNVNKDNIYIGLDMYVIGDDIEDKKIVRIWAFSADGKINVKAEKIALAKFVEKWNIKVDLNEKK